MEKKLRCGVEESIGNGYLGRGVGQARAFHLTSRVPVVDK